MKSIVWKAHDTFFMVLNSKNKGGIPPEFFEFACLNQKRVLVKNSKVPLKNCKNQ